MIARFPQRELDIRRCFMRDAQFRSICSDHDETTRALRHWHKAMEQGDAEGSRKANEYNSFLHELEEEILEHLNRP